MEDTIKANPYSFMHVSFNKWFSCHHPPMLNPRLEMRPGCNVIMSDCSTWALHE